MVISKRLVAMKINLKSRVEWSGRKLTPAGNRGKAETPQAKPRSHKTALKVDIPTFLEGGSGSSPRKATFWSEMERTCF